MIAKLSISNVVDSFIRVAKYFDDNNEHYCADNVSDFVKIAQSAINGVLNDVPGGFYLENLNNTAYGLKNGLGGYPLSGHSYWDNKGSETARQVDLRNIMMGQGGMNAKDLIDFTMNQAKQNQNDPNYRAWSQGQRNQIQRDVEMMKKQLQNPSLNADDKSAIQQAIMTYEYMLTNMPSI